MNSKGLLLFKKCNCNNWNLDIFWRDLQNDPHLKHCFRCWDEIQCYCFYTSVSVNLFVNSLIDKLFLPLIFPYLCLSSHPSPGRWAGAALSGHHVHAGHSWPRPWVSAVPRRGGGAWRGGGRRGQGEGIRQRQCCGKHTRVRHLRRADQTER